MSDVGKALIVDDEKTYVRFHEMTAEDLGIPFDSATSVSDALDLLQSGAYTHLVTDGFGGKPELKTLVDAALALNMKVSVVSATSQDIIGATLAGTQGDWRYFSKRTLEGDQPFC